LGGGAKVTLFEYLTAGFVLILSFAVVRGLSGFPHVLHQATRYWVHLGFLAFALTNCLISFWAFFSYQGASWTLPRFSLVLAIPAVLFVYNSILVPAAPATVNSWKEHYFSVRIPLCATGVLSVLLITTNNALVLGTEFPPLWIALTCLWAGVYVVGLSSKRPPVHSVLAVVQVTLGVVMLIVLSRPAPLSESAP